MPQLTSEDDDQSNKTITAAAVQNQTFQIPILDLDLSIGCSSGDNSSSYNIDNNRSNSTNNDKNNYFQNSQLVIKQVEQYEPSVFCMKNIISNKTIGFVNSAYDIYNPDYKNVI